MPTSPGIPSQPLDPKQTAAKLEGLISELTDDESPDTEAAPEVTAEKQVPPETPPPATSDSDDPAPDEDDERHTIPVDGEPIEVTLGELKKSFSYKAHNTRVAQELAEKEKRLESDVRQRIEAELAQDRERYAQGLKQIHDALQQVQGEPDWESERQKLTPEDFLKRRADWSLSQANLEKLQRLQQDEARQSDEARLQQWQKYLRSEQDKLKAAIPEWEDAAKAKAESEQLIAVAKHYGFSEQETRAVTDHRAIVLLRDAMKYRELHREPTPQRVKVSPIKTAKPGTPDRPRPNEKQTQLVERAAKTGRGRDAAAAIEAMLKD